MTERPADVDELIALVDDASARLLSTLASLSDTALRERSALPDWSRAHVLVHLARNADGLRNLLLWARTGTPARMYPSRAVRAADIATAPERSLEVITADLEAATERLRIDLAALPDNAWSRPIITTPGDVDSDPRAASVIPLMRLTEVEIHHVDLDAGSGFADIPIAAAHRLLDFIEGRLRAVDVGFQVELDHRRWTIAGSGPGSLSDEVITGSAGDLMAWLLGRGEGHGCRSLSGAGLPALAPF
ncbi:MAG: maleylpyruvate isomerase family mycothiol-dependent enzyme [Acidimicrobiia bacterium]